MYIPVVHILSLKGHETVVAARCSKQHSGRGYDVQRIHHVCGNVELIPHREFFFLHIERKPPVIHL